MTTTVILQPSYIPWLGCFEMLYRSDIFVFYDDVQYTKSDWRNRNRIKNPQGVSWLTVPIRTKGRFLQNLNETEICNNGWNRKHKKTLERFYRSAPFFHEVFHEIEPLYKKEWKKLNDLNITFMKKIMSLLGIRRELLLSSELEVPFFESPVQRVLEVCKKVNTTVFYNGAAGKNLYSEHFFAKNGIELKFQEYNHPVYRQLWGDFIPYLSILDLLFNHGKKSLDILLGKTTA